MELHIITKILLSVLVVLFPLAFSQSSNDKFIQCLSQNSDSVFTQNNTQYSSILQSTIVNLRFSASTTSKPLAIITPLTYAHVQSVVTCSKNFGYRVRIRSGGHDYAGLSYSSHDQVPFVVLDLQKLRSINIDSSKKTAWVESGATIGELYYWVSQNNKNLGFPAGVCPTIGVGGHLSGGGLGILVRKYGLAADNVVDARIIDANGKILDRKAMGKDLFWSIRGGGGGSFGIVVAWKVKLISVPDKVSVFSLSKTLEQGGSDLFNKWQSIGSKLSKYLLIRVIILPGSTGGGSRTIKVIFNSMFLGTVDNLLKTMNNSFPELGLQAKDCSEISWIESILFFANYPDTSVLRDRKPEARKYFNAKSDYVKAPIPKERLQDIWNWMLEDDNPILIMEPHGGRMDEIGETSTPYPHRKGYLYNIQYFQTWENSDASDKHLGWMRRMYTNMTPYVSKNPRSTYVNYRDLDLGENKNANNISYSEAAMQWGSKYFGNNFRKLALVKGVVDPQNFFYFEQSIPPLKA
ncbi:Berberine/berberine-like protein [Artemisia annua]|uniref:Berberine/berberine-like protein n=1 Tax=Artemisia annua TaxID=35608 RepID=A0A2U1KUM3_ARTAN|nr:Berberine/berberine-like protein [Artemisia annua]